MGFTDILLLLTTLLILAEGSTSSTMANKNFTLPSNCSKTCGDIKIEYPFGIGSGCFYADGFNLTCAYDFHPPRLLLGDGTIQVRNFDMQKGEISIKSPYVILPVDAQSINTTMINLQNLPLFFNLRLVYSKRPSYRSMSNNQLYVVGCSASANIRDVVNNVTIGTCYTICSTTNTSTTMPRSYDNEDCFLIDFDEFTYNHKSWDIELTRLNENENEHHMINNSRSSNVTAIIFNWESIISDDFGRFMDHQNRTGMAASLAWYINDHSTCEEARSTNTYACRSHNSECYDVLSEQAIYSNDTMGYNCRCSEDYVGNPYLHDGCQLDNQNFTFSPAKDCQTECGNVSFSFPFGLEQRCYRSKDFALKCNETNPPTLLYRDRSLYEYYIVSKISLQEGQLEYSRSDYYYDYRDSHFTSSKENIIINWVVGYLSCNDAPKDKATYACIYKHSICLNLTSTEDGQVMGYRCNCSNGYIGNPYLHDGCKDFNECNSSIKVCTGDCINTEGSYRCACPPGTSGDPYRGSCLPHKKNTLLFGVIIGASLGAGLLLLCVILVIIGKKWKQRNQQKIRQRNFLQNHGLLLQQLVSTSDHVEERTTIFSLEEIEKATNNFDETRILGRGGHGTVYKGILLDQRVVAIKKSKTVKKSEIDQFINEVAVLSQINHRNVVKLFGCCLETEVPLLIYEFISNGTLSDHLHVSDGESKLSWDDRLRIATESAAALAYLHSAASISIFHRDIKSSNILLDDTFKAKVSDFGASRFIPLDQTHIVTAIHGTFGYLDPEYYQTSQLTEKSDVYSFGVILLELLTRKKPVYSIKNGSQQNLAMSFFQAKRENMLFDLVEDRVLQEGTEQELLEMSSLIEICLNLKGVERPTMKEVEYKLQNIRKTRMTKKRACIPEGNEEFDCLLTMSSYSSSELVQIHQENSRNYSFEEELMNSQNYAR